MPWWKRLNDDGFTPEQRKAAVLLLVAVRFADRKLMLEEAAQAEAEAARLTWVGDTPLSARLDAAIARVRADRAGAVAKALDELGTPAALGWAADACERVAKADGELDEPERRLIELIRQREVRSREEWATVIASMNLWSDPMM